jgi:hypothetical protein
MIRRSEEKRRRAGDDTIHTNCKSLLVVCCCMELELTFPGMAHHAPAVLIGSCYRATHMT